MKIKGLTLQQWGIIIFTVGLALAGFLLLLPVLFLYTLAMALPTAIGRFGQIEYWMKSVIDSIVGIQNLETTRNDIIGIFTRQAQIKEGIDQWSQLRMMELAIERVNLRLLNGEFLITFFGGLLAIVLGVYVGVQWAAILLTLLGAVIAMIVFFRTILIDLQAYKADLYVNHPAEEVAVLKGWNDGPMVGRGSFLMIPLTLLANRSDFAYQFMLEVIEAHYERKFHKDIIGRYKAGSDS